MATINFNKVIISRMLFLVLFSLLSSQGLAQSDKGEGDKPNSLPRYSNTELLEKMLVVDVSERRLHDLPALAITFSQKLNETSQPGKYITLTEAGKLVNTDGKSWIMADDPRRLYYTNIKPEHQYRMQLRPGIEAQSGKRLEKPVDFTLKSGSVQPAFDFVSKGGILPTHLVTGLELRVVNVPELDFEFLRVAPDKVQDVLRQIRLNGRLNTWELERIGEFAESVHSMRYTTDARRNASEQRVLSVADIPALQQSGLYFVVMRRPGAFGVDAYRITYFTVSNIGLHVRRYSDRLTVFANSLDQGKVISDLTLKLQGRKQTVTLDTDEHGMATFTDLPSAPLLLTAQQDKDFAFLDLREASLDLSDYAVDGQRNQAIKPFMYAGRDLYRPGEAVNLSIILRDNDGLPTDLETLQLQVLRPDTKPLLETTLQARQAKLGYFQHRIVIPKDAPTGSWVAEVRADPEAKQPLNRFEFQVEAFMPERMNMTLNAGEAVLQTEQKLVVAVQGDYLYGAPASGNKVTGRYASQLQRHPLPQAKGFYFGNEADVKALPNAELPELKLNEQGGGFLEVPAIMQKIDSPLQLRVLASLYEAGGRTINRSLTHDFWPAPALVGLRPQFKQRQVDERESATFQVGRFNAQGESLAAEKLIATLIRIEHEYYWEYSEHTGWRQRHSSNEYPLQQQMLALTKETPLADLDFKVDSGRYRLEVEDPETGLKAIYAFRSGWASQDQQGSKPDQITMQLDKPRYQPGDTLAVTVTPPAAGEAILMLESDRLLWSKHVTLPQAGQRFEIPLSEDWVHHDLYLSALSFRPADKQQKITPNRALGMVHVPLDRESRQVKLAITAPEKTLPEKSVVVQVSAEDLAGQDAIVTLSAIDQGVLNITRFAVPDPWDYYFSQHRYPVNQYDLYGKVIDYSEGNLLRQRYGGGMTSGGAGADNHVQIVALFSGVVPFDDKGNAEIVLQLPGFDGQLRLTAVAMSETQLGATSRELKVASPVVPSLAGPRFLAFADQGKIVLELRNTTEKEQKFSVDVAVEGQARLAFVPGEYALAPDERKVINIPVTAKQQAGLAEMTLRLEGDDFVANRKLVIPVRSPYPQQSAHRQYKISPEDGDITLDKTIIQGLATDSLQARLSLNSSPNLQVRDSLSGLMNYPYGCLEQTTSRAYPYLYLDSELLESLSLPALDRATRRQHVDNAIQRLSGMQIASGGFNLWGGAGQAEYWLTSYVTAFLQDARAQGFTVPDYMERRAITFLQKLLTDGYNRVRGRYAYSDSPAHLDFAARAYAAWVLARVDKGARVSLGVLRPLYDKHIKYDTSPLPLVHLGLALLKRGDRRRGEEALRRAFKINRADNQYYGDYGSPLRDDALSLALLLSDGRSIDDLGKHIKVLSDLIYQKPYLSTQEQVAIFRLARELFLQGQKKWSATLQMGASSKPLKNQGTYYQTLSAADLEQGVTLSTSGSQALFASLKVQGYPETAPAAKQDIIQVQRDWYSLKGEKLSPERIKAGDLILSHVSIQSKQNIRDALLVDLLPAAFELENSNISASADIYHIKLQDLDKSVGELLDHSYMRYEAFRDDRYIAALDIRKDAHHHVFYLQRVVSVGEFSVPAVKLEDMYRPSVYGLSESGERLQIKMP